MQTGRPAETAQHAAGRRAVKINRVADAGKHRGDDVGLAVGGKADVADESLRRESCKWFRGRRRRDAASRTTRVRSVGGNGSDTVHLMRVAHGAELIAGAESA